MNALACTGCGWTMKGSTIFISKANSLGINGFGIKAKSELFIGGVTRVVFLK